MKHLWIIVIKRWKIWKKVIVDNDEILSFGNEIRDEDATIEDLKKYFPEKIEKIQEALDNYVSENDLNLFKTEFPDK